MKQLLLHPIGYNLRLNVIIYTLSGMPLAFSYNACLS
jgi:hypothetical protein